MMPIGPLMIEHRLIERMIGLMLHELDSLHSGKSVALDFVEATVDFFRIYADRCHHGKEEQILFKSLEKKELDKELAKIMVELIEEHAFARERTEHLARARDDFIQGLDTLPVITGTMTTLAEFYPHHIQKEDKHFFIPGMQCFTNHEKDAMLEEFSKFDGELVHELYQDTVARYEQEQGISPKFKFSGSVYPR